MERDLVLFLKLLRIRGEVRVIEIEVRACKRSINNGIIDVLLHAIPAVLL